MNKDPEKDLDNRRYEGAILIFALVQVVIGISQLLISSIDSDHAGARFVASTSIILLVLLMIYIFREIKKSK